jgi:putative ABC transport system permease protein
MPIMPYTCSTAASSNNRWRCSVESIINDLRTALRALARKPGFTLVVALTLAVGIGANTAIFSVVNGVLLRPLRYPQDDRIVTIWQSAPSRGVEREETSPANFTDWGEQNQSFETMGLAEPWGHLLTSSSGEPEANRSWIVSTGFFEALGVQPLLGRTFTSEEYQPGGSPVVILGYKWWRQHFGGDRSVIGQKLTFNNQLTTVVGVMPQEFEFPPGRQLWAPRPRRANDPQNRGRTFVWVVGRLKPGRTVAQAGQDMTGIGARLAAQYPQTNAGIGVTLVPLREFLLGDVRPALLVLFGAVGLVLLLACANVANLLLVRGAERQRELAIRSALGAGRGRIVRQLMSESLVLASLGGLCGVLLSVWLIRVIVLFGAEKLPRLEQVNLNPAVLIFAIGLSLVTAVLFGLAPALQETRLNLHEMLKEGTHAATAGGARQRLRRVLVVAQVAIAFVLLVGAGLLVRSFAALLDTSPGFNARNALTLEVSLGRRTQEQRNVFLNSTLERLAALPGVVGTGASSSLPFSENQVAQPTTIAIEGRPSSTAEGDVTANLSSVTPDYFHVLGVPLVRGRLLTRFDTRETPVVVINQTMARRYWSGDDPIGKRISFTSYGGPVTTEIVGIVGDTRTAGLEIDPKPEIFVAYASALGYPNSMTYFLRTSTDPLSLLPAVKQSIHEVDKSQTFSTAASLDQLVERSLNQRRFNLALLGSFALLALVLAGVGLYGIVSFTTSQRTREIGLRMAFGADRRDVLWMIIAQGMTLTAAGIAIGALASLALTRVMASLLYGISETDPLTFAAIALVLGLIPPVACWVPARRATNVDPMVALRYE